MVNEGISDTNLLPTMKITLFSLFVTSSLAMAVSISPITDPTAGTWGTGTNQQDHISINAEDNTVTSTDTNWNADYGLFLLADAMTLSSLDTSMRIEFSYTLNNTGNSAETLALLDGTAKLAVVSGHMDYVRGTNLGLGSSTNVSSYTQDNGAHGYLLGGNGNNGRVANVTASSTLTGGTPVGSSTISGIIAWDGDSYAVTLSSSAVEGTTTMDLNVTEFTLDGMIVTLDGNNPGSIGNITLSLFLNQPQPHYHS